MNLSSYFSSYLIILIAKISIINRGEIYIKVSCNLSSEASNITTTLATLVGKWWRCALCAFFVSFRSVCITVTVCEKCPYSEFFWSVFCRIQSKCGKIRNRKTWNTYTFHVVLISFIKSHYGLPGLVNSRFP